MDLLSVIARELAEMPGFEREDDGVMAVTLIAVHERQIPCFDSPPEREQALHALAAEEE